MAKGDSFIHVKLNYNEVTTSKRDLLASEIDILQIIKSMGRYVVLRQKELELKAQFYREIKKMSMSIRMLETSLPHVQIPKMLNPSEEKPAEKRKSMMPGEDNLEEQLREIQRKLKSLS